MWGFIILNFLAQSILIISVNTTPLDAFEIKAKNENTCLKDYLFKDPVHELITCRAFLVTEFKTDLPEKPKNYPFPPGVSKEAVLWGVEWNDDPPFVIKKNFKNGNSSILSTKTSARWIASFEEARNKAQDKAREANVLDFKYPLLHRIHFGDLQFIHAMATKKNEVSKDTQERIMMWAEFTYKIANGTLDKNSKLGEIKVTGFDTYFPKKENVYFPSYNDTPINLFTLGNPALENNVQEIALGSLLHLVQDSFVKSHVKRNKNLSGVECKGIEDSPGVIEQFHTYIGQDTQKHKEEDSKNAYKRSREENDGTANVEKVSRHIVHLWLRKAEWYEMSNYLKCVFAISDPTMQSGPGEEFR
jgi:hypothetical protein